MPVTLEAETLHHALARLEERDYDAAARARASLSWLGWDDAGPLHLRRYELQLHLWYELPTKVLTSLDDKCAIAAALAQLLEMTPAAAYAPLCTAPETLAQIERWETDDKRARRELGRLLDASGIEPPDTPLLAWSSIMGLAEAQTREEVAYELELALEDGALAPGAPGFKPRQIELTRAALLREGRLEAIHAERLQRWRDDQRSPTRTALIARVADAIAQPPADREPGDSLVAARWLLERAVDGTPLTQAGALNRALVRDVVELRPEWWDTDLFGPPNREDDVHALGRLHELLRAMRLLRRSGRRVIATARGRALLAQPTELLDACATALLAGDTFDATVGELASALLLAGEPIAYDRLEHAIHPAILEQGWQSGGFPPSVHAVGGAIGDLLAGLEALDLVSGSRHGGRKLAPTGHHALVIGLRARAFAPKTRL